MSHRHERERRAEVFCLQYLSFWGIVCLGCVFVFGWPVLLTWLGVFWVLMTFLQLLLERENNTSRHRSRKPPCSRHR